MNFFSRIFRGVSGFYRTGADRPLLEDEGRIRRMYERKRWEVFLSIVIGYSFFYVTRLSINVAKKPIVDSGILTVTQLGQIGFAIWLSYAFGKLINGFIADRCNMKKFMTTGLLVSAVINILFGFTNFFIVFVMLWFLNGWFQSMGCAPSVVVMSQWFSNRERGTRYGLWSAAHSIGEGITFAVTAAIVTYFGWRWGLWGAGGITIVIAILMYIFLSDRPRTYGLPAIADYKNDQTGTSEDAPLSIKEAQWGVIKHPAVWILGISSACLYVARYGVNSWGMMYLQEAKEYSLITAGFVLGLAKIVETAGAVTSGFVSDFLFGSKRNPVALLYGIVMVSGLILLFHAPSTHLFNMNPSYAEFLTGETLDGRAVEVFKENGLVIPEGASLTLFDTKEERYWIVDLNTLPFGLSGYRIQDTGEQLHVCSKYSLYHVAGSSLFGFGLGGLLVFLGGLMAVDFCSKKATGAAMGLVGVFSYLGAAVQEWVSGGLIEAGEMMVDGQLTHNFDNAFYFWLGAAVVAVLLPLTLWKVRAKE